MPKYEADPEDPMALVGMALPAESLESVAMMAQCFAEEFSAMGYSADEVLALFRNPEYRSARLAMATLGEDRVAEMVYEICARREAARRPRHERGPTLEA